MRAEKEINLIPVETKAGHKRTLIITGIISCALVLVVITLFAYILPRVQIAKMKSENAELKEKIAAVGDIDELLKKYESKQSELKVKEGALTVVENDQVKVLDFLKRLSSYIPQGIFVSNISINNGNTLNITFGASGPVDIARLTVKLRESDEFETVELESAPLKDSAAPEKYPMMYNLKMKKK